MADQTISVKITADGEELRREIENDLTALNRLQAATVAGNKAGVAATREAIEAQRSYMQSVNASSDSFNRLDQLQQRFEQRVESSATRSAGALNSMARGFSVLESSSHASVRSIDAVSNAASQLAFGFGPQGMLIGAAVMVGIAIVRSFEKSAEAVKKLREKTEEEFVKLGESLSAETAHQDFERSQQAFDAIRVRVEAMQAKIDTAAKKNDFLGVGYWKEQIKPLLATMGELNTETDRFYSIWQDFSKLTPMSELKKEIKETDAALAKQKKLLDEYTAKYGSNATYNDFLKKNEKLPTFSPGADITKDALKIEPPKIDKTAFQVEINELKLFAAGFKEVGDSAKLMQSVASSAFGALLSSMGGLAGGAKEMKRALLEPIAVWLRATAIKEFVAGLADLANPFAHQFAAKHFVAAAEASAGYVVVSALAGSGGGGGSGRGGGGGGGSGSGSATQLGAGAGASQGPMKIEITYVQKQPDGREVARYVQKIQRNKDLAQPIRAVL